MIEWIVWRVDTGVKKKLMMGWIVYGRGQISGFNAFTCNAAAQGIPAAYHEIPGTLGPLEANPESELHAPRRASATHLTKRRRAGETETGTTRLEVTQHISDLPEELR